MMPSTAPLQKKASLGYTSSSNVYLANVWSEIIISQRCPFVHVCNKLQIQHMQEVPKEQGTPERAWPSGKIFSSSFLCLKKGSSKTIS